MQEVFMDFDENDDPVISVKGVKGKACKELTKGLELALGKVVDVSETEEYHQQEVGNAARALNKR